MALKQSTPSSLRPRKRGVAFSLSEVEYLRERLDYALCAIRNESVYLSRLDDPTDSDEESREFLECAAEDLELADALLESRALAGTKHRIQ